MRLAAFTGAESLSLSQALGMTKQTLSGLTHFPRVIHLTVTLSSLPLLTAALQVTQLQSLHLTWRPPGCTVSSVNAVQSQNVAQLPWTNLLQLKSLELRPARVPLMGTFDRVSVLTNLENLHVCGYPSMDGLRNLKKLTSLSITADDLIPADEGEYAAHTHVLTSLQTLSQLRRLCLAEQHDCQFGRVSTLTNLSCLEIYGIHPMLDEPVDQVMSLTKLCHLTRLQKFYCRFGCGAEARMAEECDYPIMLGLRSAPQQIAINHTNMRYA